MPPKDKKHSCLSVSLDIVSNLPGDIIDAILVRLPLRDVVRTSILSKKWRYKWCKLPELALDLITMESRTDIVDHLLTLHSGPITKFTLYFIPYMIPGSTIDNLIYFLSRNGIQHLVLRLPWGSEPYKLPSSFFTCLQLRHLALQMCSIELPPPAFKGFDKLISLELSGVTIFSKLLECLICNCSLLEQLVLEISEISSVIEIKAPMLKSFDFRGRQWDIAKFFGSFSVVKHLQLKIGSLKSFAAGAGVVPKRLPFDLTSVKFLYLSGIYLDEVDVVLCALCLIRSIPDLQYMEIEVFDCGEDSPALECLEVEGFSGVTFSRLREVNLQGDLAIEPGIQLIKLLLAKSPVLVRMLIKPSIHYDNRSQLDEFLYRTDEMVNVVREFRRASPIAVFDYDIEYDPDCYMY
ncbi:F-box/FBD/LRR-repeat protein At1g13570-like [Lycium ferocissimum]|uniref:F-box/FBD/LRR-repeat protein At1g13570-like n=1 Tax=Lycium ferocissimum TaxID=112874 RepID=UPI0028156AA0|nr:F-box/FBD/LRR-repeat protein At1g13570-like [Lycium ferocissimum]